MKNKYTVIMSLCILLISCDGKDKSSPPETSNDIISKENKIYSEDYIQTNISNESAHKTHEKNSDIVVVEKIDTKVDKFNNLLDNKKKSDTYNQLSMYDWSKLKSENDIYSWAHSTFNKTRSHKLVVSNAMSAFAYLTNSVDKNMSSHALTYFAKKYAREQDYEKAESIFNDILSLYDKNMDTLTEDEQRIVRIVLDSRIILSSMKGDYKQEIERRHERIDMMKNEPNCMVYSHLAFAYINAEEREKAIEYMQNAMEKAESEYNEHDGDMYTREWCNKYISNWNKGGVKSLGSSL
jgi:tetratricopeptide (TPR) repeat protein